MRYTAIILNITLWFAFMGVVIEQGVDSAYFDLGEWRMLIMGILVVPALSALVIWLYTTDEDSILSLWVQVKRKKLKDQLDK